MGKKNALVHNDWIMATLRSVIIFFG